MRAELFDGTILEFEEGTPKEVIHRVALEQTERIRTNQARKPLPEDVKPSEAGAGRGGQGAPTAEELTAAAPAPEPAVQPAKSDLGGVMAGIRGNEAARQKRLGQSGAQPLPADIAPSNAGAGRGSVNPYNATVRRADQPFADKREAVDEAVDLIESGADREKVYRAFEQNGVMQSDIEARGIELKGKQFTADINAGTVRGGATADTMQEGAPTATEGVTNFGKRVAARTSQAATGVMANTGLFGTEGLAASLARDQKRIEAAAPGKKVQAELESLSKVKDFAEVPAALIQNPRGAAMMLFESLAMTAPMMVAGGVAGLPAKGLAAVTGVGSGGLEFGSVLTDSLSEKGVNVLDAEAVKKALDDPKFMEEVRSKATKRGLTIGAADALTAGFAGKFLEPALEAVRAGKLVGAEAMRATAGAWAKELGLQMAGGAGGEAIGQAVTGENKPLDIVMEALGEAAGAPVEAYSNLKEAKRAQTLAAYERAKTFGFEAKPIMESDAPEVQRGKSVKIFEGIAALSGIPEAAVKRARQAATELPLEEVGPFLTRLLGTLASKNLIQKPVEEAVSALLTLPPLSEAQADAALAKIEKQGAEDVKALRDFRAETKPTASESIAAATASEPAKTETVLQESGSLADPINGDILTKAGNPFATERSAKRVLANNPDHEIVQVQGGFVVRKKATAATPVDEAAHVAATSPQNDLPEPTQAQKEAGNYQKGHARIAGLDLSIENPEGSQRSGVDPDGTPWSNTMAHHYGYIRGTTSIDGEHIDTFIKPGTAPDYAGDVFIVDQATRDGQPDEHKVMLGFDTIEEAQAAYAANYAKGWKGLKAITPATIDEFKTWLREGDTRQPYRPEAYSGSAQPDIQPIAPVSAAPSPGRSGQPGGRGRDLGPDPAASGLFDQPAAGSTVPGGGGDLALEPRSGEPGAVERRGDAAARKKVGEMSPEELRAALHTDELTGLRNGRWLNENIDDFSHVVAFDADSLKFINDTMGHESGDALLRAWGEALKAATPNSARAGGDEFFALANSQEEAEAIAERARQILAEGTITAETPEGEVITIKGIGVSFGIGTSKKAADEKLNQHKRAREAAGERAGRGEAPPGTTRAAARRQQNQVSEGQREDVQALDGEGLVVIPASEDAFADALNSLKAEDQAATAEADEDMADGVDAETLRWVANESARYKATFFPDTKPVSLPRVTEKKPQPKGMDFITPEQAEQRLESWKAEAMRQGSDPKLRNYLRTVISLFDASGVMAQPWIDAGYNVVSYDLQTGADITEFDAQNLIEQHGNDEIWAIIGQPPCTDFASSGAQWWKDKDADGRTEASNELVRQNLRTVELFRPPVWLMENPVGRIAKLNKLPEPLLQMDPWHYGDPYTKRTLLWGNFDPNLPLAPVEPTEGSKIHRMSSSAKYERSLTPEGFAYAFFMANNAAAMSGGKRMAAEFPGIEAELFDAALKSGTSEYDVRSAIEDAYYDNDLEEVRAELARIANPAGLTDEQAFVSDYSHFEGRTVEQPVRLSDSGQTAVLRIDAAKVMRTLDDRLKALRDLRTCIGRSA